jgi:hypothetical protein
MQIAIISDSHDNVANLEKLIRWLNKNRIFTLIHAGDLSAPGVLKKTLGPGFAGEIHLIFGNVGDKVLLKKIAAEFSNVKYYGEKGEIEIDGKKIIFVHFPEEAEKIAKKEKCDLIIYGHTHQAEIKDVNGNLLINPGTVGGLYNKPTFAIYDTEKGKVKVIDLDNLE